MTTIPTAEDFIPQYLDANNDFIESIKQQMSHLSGINFDNIPDLMIEFAKLHVEACKKELIKKGKIKAIWKTKGANPKILGSYTQVFEGYQIDEESILNAYPLEQIK